MTKDQARREEVWADNLYAELRCFDPPMDLHAVARNRQVTQLKLRPMIQRGALLPSPGGYEIIVRNLESKDIDLELPEGAKELTSQQRFTLAHEIAHTRFYKLVKGKPVPTKESKQYAHAGEIGLEEICDRAAARLLAPTPLLKRQFIERLNNDTERIDAGFVRTLVTIFRTSFDVMVQQLRAADLENVFARCIMFVAKKDEQFKIQSWYRGMSLLSALPTPENYQPLRTWLPGLPQGVDSPGQGTWRFDSGGREFSVQKFPLGKRAFLLQFDDLAHRAPDSGFSWND